MTPQPTQRPSDPPPVALPQLQPGVSVQLLKRVWFATPADRRHERAQLLDSIVAVDTGSHVEAKPLRDLTLAEVEACIGAVTPRWVVKYYQPGKLGKQLQTFVVRADADKFAETHQLYCKPAIVEPIL